MRLPDGEPAAGPFHLVDLDVLVERLLPVRADADRGPRVLAVDGRSASGKSTLAERIRRSVDGAVILHTDDLAWRESFFSWSDLLLDHVLLPLRERRSVRFRPPAWVEHGREGTIDVPLATPLLVVEGVGANRREAERCIDAAVWLQSDFLAAEQRGLARDIATGVNGGPEDATAFWYTWLAEELAFLRDDRPWERAQTIVAGTPPFEVPVGMVAVADGPLRG